MNTTNTNVHEIADGLFRLSTPVPPSVIPGGFTFNQFLLVDDEPLLFHTGLRAMFPSVRDAVARVLGDVTRLRWGAFRTSRPTSAARSTSGSRSPRAPGRSAASSERRCR
jgi:hypothetical protein